MLKLAHSIIRHFQPDYGAVYSDEYDELITDYDDPDFKPEPGKPKPGWIVYLADGYWPLPELPADAYHERIPNRGDLVAVVTETFDTENADHVEAANRFRDLLFSVEPTK